MGNRSEGFQGVQGAAGRLREDWRAAVWIFSYLVTWREELRALTRQPTELLQFLLQVIPEKVVPGVLYQEDSK